MPQGEEAFLWKETAMPGRSHYNPSIFPGKSVHWHNGKYNNLPLHRAPGWKYRMVKSAKAWTKISPSTESLPKFKFSIYIIYQKTGPVNKNKK